METHDEIRALMLRDGFLKSSQVEIEALSGGVSSEIYRVCEGGRCFVVKRALGKLKVKDDWYADVGRNRFERQYMEFAEQVLPGSVPAVLGGSDADAYFLMEFLGEGFLNWKTLLLDGKILDSHARMVGTLLGSLHRQSRSDPALAKCFDTGANFRELRLSPYLLTAGERNASLCEALSQEAERLMETRECLVHGDFSPKNIMIHESRAVILDCEVAWYGDGAFDLSFLLNHLCLKSWHKPEHRERLLCAARQCVQAYEEAVVDLDFARLNQIRSARLLPMLMLARVDGKSPVEYLEPSAAQKVRRAASQCIASPSPRLDEVMTACVSEI